MANMDRPPPHAWLFMQAFHYTRRTFDEAVRPHGISATQLGVLNRLAERPGLSGAELGRSMLTTSQAAQLMLKTLERRGLVERAPDPNHGRIVRSVLTEEGRRVVDVCAPVVRRVDQELFAVLDAEERAALVDLLLRYMHETPPTPPEPTVSRPV
ncbi:MAG: MarR family winged helix-turn-helix transcriptional regulator [Acidimicrobiia bacterium]